MLLGAFTAYYIALETDSARLGVIGALAVGALMGLLGDIPKVDEIFFQHSVLVNTKT